MKEPGALFWILTRLQSIEEKLDRLLAMSTTQSERMTTMSAELDALETQVTANTSVEESAVVLIKGIAAQLAAAGTDPAKLTALRTSLNTSATDLAAAVAANTPVAPPA
jgi:predicted  nucleic acid-binding Zn-ribbon protein